VEKKANDSCFHIHAETISTWSHVGRVEKNAYPTTKQTQKNGATTKSRLLLKQYYGTLKTATPTRRKKKTIARV
jgi:hypothetical protein